MDHSPWYLLLPTKVYKRRRVLFSVLLPTLRLWEGASLSLPLPAYPMWDWYELTHQVSALVSSFQPCCLLSLDVSREHKTEELHLLCRTSWEGSLTLPKPNSIPHAFSALALLEKVLREPLVTVAGLWWKPAAGFAMACWESSPQVPFQVRHPGTSVSCLSSRVWAQMGETDQMTRVHCS